MSLDSTTMSTSMSSTDHNVEQLSKLIHVSRTVLLQAVDLVDHHLSTDEQLTVSSKFLPGSTIGKHLRHARDHFVLLLESISTQPPYFLSYDTRLRNTPMETSRAAAQEALLDTIKRLDGLALETNMSMPIKLHAITPHDQEFQTTFGRELWFAGLHCVHHWSMVRVIAGEMGIQLSEDFGFAPSTLVYQDREAPLGKAKI